MSIWLYVLIVFVVCAILVSAYIMVVSWIEWQERVHVLLIQDAIIAILVKNGCLGLEDLWFEFRGPGARDGRQSDKDHLVTPFRQALINLVNENRVIEYDPLEGSKRYDISLEYSEDLTRIYTTGPQ